jgi:hypothetical protein
LESGIVPGEIAHKKQLSLQDAFSVASIRNKPSTTDGVAENSPLGRKRTLLLDSEQVVVDIEDTLTGSLSPTMQLPHLAKVTTHLPSPPSVHEEVLPVISIDEDVAPLSTTPSHNEMCTWLAARKQQWKTLRTARKALSISLQSHGNHSAQQASKRSAHNNVLDFVRNANVDAHTHSWQIVEIHEKSSETPGEFEVFAFTASQQLQRLSLTVPRLLYINLISSKASLDKKLTLEKKSKQPTLSVTVTTSCRERLISFLLSLGAQRVSRDLPRERYSQDTLFSVSLNDKSFSLMQLLNALSSGVFSDNQLAEDVAFHGMDNINLLFSKPIICNDNCFE